MTDKKNKPIDLEELQLELDFNEVDEKPLRKKRAKVEVEVVVDDEVDCNSDDDDTELAENEEYISRDDLDIEVMMSAEDNSIYVKFTGFNDNEEMEAYAHFLAETLPLLLFETTRIH